ncbi:hypothetical protein [Actinophytocola oryzae]|uniref:Uncharacterized protein n=1 Tax=Actinophytocola oryzae TaxID=502181 RepID=A0A4R7VRS1_9PSEU|nr:hypothetical protein [Actinophytocola oryzae]TDV52444.1 hypothetical protein CLV71_105576 [Actinophytocola oryzae]
MLIGIGGYLGTALVVAALRMAGVLPFEQVSWLHATLLVTGLIVYFELSRPRRPRLRWRELQTSDFLQALTFPGLYPVGWLDVLGKELSGWGLALAASGITAVVCVIACEFALRIPTAIADFRRKVSGPLTEESRRFNLDYRRHELFCRAHDERSRSRILMKARRGARLRREARLASSREGRFCRWVDEHVLRPYEDVGFWLGTYTTSAAIFAVLFPRMEPGLLSTLLVFLPFALMPVLEYAWRRTTGRR